MTYTQKPAKVTECHVCGEVRMCDIYVADYGEAETGYVDEYVVCAHCEKPRYEPDEDRSRRYHRLI